MQRTILSTGLYYPKLPKWVQLPRAGGDLALEEGCHLLLLTFDPELPGQASTRFQGTLRVQKREPDQIRASGDLYILSAGQSPKEPPRQQNQEIPTFPPGSYRAYLSLLQVEAASGLRLLLEVSCLRQETATWERRGSLRALLPAPSSPSRQPTDPMEGRLEEDGRAVGTIRVQWLSTRLRECVVRLDRVRGLSLPGTATDWEDRLKDSGWHVELDPGGTFPQPSGGTSRQWTRRELLTQLRTIQRENPPADERWRYHVLAVGDVAGASWGQRFRDTSMSPLGFRAGAALEGDRMVDRSRPPGNQMHHQIAALFLHTGLHEFGHTAGLDHESVAPVHIMTGTASLSSLLSSGYPDRFSTRFNEEGRWFLGHLPDPMSRPEGLKTVAPFLLTGDAVVEAAGLRLKVFLHASPLPFGAPLRLSFQLQRISGEALGRHTLLALASGVLEGVVRGGDGEARTFGPSTVAWSYEKLADLLSKDIPLGSVSAFQNESGPLFPSPGAYRLEGQLRWREEGGWRVVFVDRDIEVPKPESEEHAAAANALLPMAGLEDALSFGEGAAAETSPALRLALRSEALRGHWQIAEIFNSLRQGRLEEAAAGLEESPLLTAQEIGQVARGFLQAVVKPAELPRLREAHRLLSGRLSDLPIWADPESRRAVVELGKRVGATEER